MNRHTKKCSLPVKDLYSRCASSANTDVLKAEQRDFHSKLNITNYLERRHIFHRGLRFKNRHE